MTAADIHGKESADFLYDDAGFRRLTASSCFSLLFNSGELLFSRASLLEFTVVLSDTQFTWNSAVEIARGVGKVAAAAAALIDH